MAQQDLMFEPFQQLDPNKEKSGPGLGLGLGLAVCKRLIEVQGGRIWLQPDTLTGTTISFTLPIV